MATIAPGYVGTVRPLGVKLLWIIRLSILQKVTRMNLQRSISELAAKAELAELDQGIAQDQLNATLVQLTTGSGRASAPPITLKDELKARIRERQRYLEVPDATFQLREAEIHLLRQTGQLDDRIRSVGHAQTSTPIKP